MNRAEAIDVLELALMQWPHYDIDPRLPDLWATVLEPYPVELVLRAVRHALGSAKHPPTVAEIRELCDAWHPPTVVVLHHPAGPVRREIPERFEAAADDDSWAPPGELSGLAAWHAAARAELAADPGTGEIDLRGSES